MLFSSPRFLLFLLVLLVLLGPRWSTGGKKKLLAVFSCLFYAAWDFRYLGLLLAVSGIDYFCAAKIDRSEVPRVRRFWLLVSLISNLGILAYFKYFNFFIDNLNGLFSVADVSFAHANILLPAGISFYTFKSMSYTIDVYRRHIRPCRSQIDYTTFITFFPELIAGPIVRASIFLPQMNRQIGPTVERMKVGLSLFLLGLTKKLLMADRLSPIVDPIFASPDLYSAPSIWMGVIAYTLQIYCDFSGYSDMAIGTAKMLGYDLPENFDMPYVSRNIAEFWRRWHITLSSWLRDYLYIPLGGNRRGRSRTYINLMITMLLGGLWHGASWNFVVWGLLHGIALAVHKLFSDRFPRVLLPAAFSRSITFLFVVLCWIPFRSADFQTTMTILERMFRWDSTGARWYPEILLWVVPLAVAGHLLGVWIERTIAAGASGPRLDALLGVVDARVERDEISGWYLVFRAGTFAGAFLVMLWILSVYFFAATEASPFIYFQF